MIRGPYFYPRIKKYIIEEIISVAKKSKYSYYKRKKEKRVRMRHYKQIIIDLSVDDDTDDKKIRELEEKIKKYVKNTVDGKDIQVVSAKVD